jgi:hypothetical protein
MVARRQINLRIVILAMILATLAAPAVIYRLVSNVLVTGATHAVGAFQGRLPGSSEQLYALSTVTHQFALATLTLMGVFLWASSYDLRWSGTLAWIPLLIALGATLLVMPVIFFVSFFHILPSVLVIALALAVVATGMFESAFPRLRVLESRR